MYVRFFIGNQILYKIQQTKSFEKKILDITMYDNYIYSHKFQVQNTNFYLIFWIYTFLQAILRIDFEYLLNNYFLNSH